MSEDRNAKSRREFQEAAQRRQIMHQLDQQKAAFALDFAAGKAALVDRNGMQLDKGQLILWSPPPGFTYWQVIDLKPNVQPNVPVGVVTLTIQATVPLHYQVGRSCGDVLIVGAAQRVEAVDTEISDALTPTAAETDHPQEDPRDDQADPTIAHDAVS